MLGLCWEGGGAKGAFGAKILYELNRVYSDLKFDELCGSSVGGISILFLIKDSFKVLNFIWEKIKDKENFIFKEQGLRYNTYNFLINTIQTINSLNLLDKIKNSDSLLISVAVSNNGKVVLFTNKDLETKEDIIIKKIETEEDLIYAILGTSAIPKFFPEVRFKLDNETTTLLDGGVKYTFPIKFLIDFGKSKKIIGIIHEPYEKLLSLSKYLLQIYPFNLIKKFTLTLTKKNLKLFNRVEDNIFVYKDYKLFLIYPFTDFPSAMDFSKDSIEKSFSIAKETFSKIKDGLISFIEN
ncbi:MAG: patatin-like phospholipase family protein [Caldisericia bacterium]